MLGLRGVRLCLAIPGLVELQVRAIAEAAAERRKTGGDPSPRSRSRWSAPFRSSSLPRRYPKPSSRLFLTKPGSAWKGHTDDDRVAESVPDSPANCGGA